MLWTFRHVMTGSYHNYFRIFDVNSSNDIVLQADKSAFKQKKLGQMGKNAATKNGMRPGGLKEQMNLETLDFNKKILHGSWHPRENTLAVSFVVPYTFIHSSEWHFYRSRPRTTCSSTAQHSLATDAP